MLEVNEADRVATLNLPERADASTALAMHEVMMRADLEHINSVAVDVSAAMRVDASALQLLLAWFNLLDSHQIPWRWRGTSEAFSIAADHAGLRQVLRLTNG